MGEEQVWCAEHLGGYDPRAVGHHDTALSGKRTEPGELVHGSGPVMVAAKSFVGVGDCAGGGAYVEVLEFGGDCAPDRALVTLVGAGQLPAWCAAPDGE